MRPHTVPVSTVILFINDAHKSECVKRENKKREDKRDSKDRSQPL